jgi:hypothetical protein
LVDVGTELFVMSAVCSRALRISGERPGDSTAIQLADAFCHQARRRIRDSLRGVFDNDDVRNYSVAREVLGGAFEWMEAGVIGLDEGSSPRPVRRIVADDGSGRPVELESGDGSPSASQTEAGGPTTA